MQRRLLWADFGLPQALSVICVAQSYTLLSFSFLSATQVLIFYITSMRAMLNQIKRKDRLRAWGSLSNEQPRLDAYQLTGTGDMQAI